MRFDQHFKKRIHQATDHVTSLQEKTWENISKELFTKEPLQKRKQKPSWFKRIVPLAVGIAVLCLLSFLVLSETFTKEGDLPQTLHQDVKEKQNKPIDQELHLADLFETEKESVIELEGMEETITMELATNENWRYIIYVDPAHYTFSHKKEVDTIEPTGPVPETYPPVKMEIKRHDQVKEENLIQVIKSKIEEDGLAVFDESTVQEPIEGIKITALAEDEAPGEATVHRYYIVEVDHQVFFTFKQSFFEEAFEGHGSRFNHMIESFKWVK